MEEKFLCAMNVLHSLNEGTYIHKKKAEPIGVQAIPNGYRVRFKDHPVRTFQNKKFTMEEKLTMAVQYAESIY